jgi:hypothetical protein
MSVERIVFLIVIVVVWIAVIAVGFKWLRPGDRVIRWRYLAVSGVTAVGLTAMVIVGVFGRSLWIALFGAIGLLLLGPVVYRQLRSASPDGSKRQT